MLNNQVKIGRPTKYNKEITSEICNTIASSSVGLRRLCKQNSHWPNPDTIYRWLAEHKEFSDQYARAKHFQVGVIIDEILDIADDTAQDTISDEHGNTRYNKEHIHRSRLRIDTRKWLASKLVPKIYGKYPEIYSIQHEHKTIIEQLLFNTLEKDKGDN